MIIELYTQLEVDFLEKVLELFQIDYTETTEKEPFSHTVFSITAGEKEQNIIKACMMYNYEKNFK